MGVKRYVEHTMSRIPTLDFAGFDHAGTSERAVPLAELRRACEAIGFLCVRGHGIAPATIEAMRDTVVSVFAQPEPVKKAGAISPDNYRGYIPLGFFSANAGGGKPDRYEGYKLHTEIASEDPVCKLCPLYGPNKWVASLPRMALTVLAFWRETDAFAAKLLCAFALALGLDESAFLAYFAKPLTNMTLLHYPPTTSDREGFGIHPHKDSDAFTILCPDPVGGLFVRARTGDWIEVAAPPDAVIVNIGDIMEHWSGGRFVSTPHKVVNRSGAERYSFPYFAVPGHDTVVRPLVEPVAGFAREPLAVGPWQADVWRSNWPDAAPIAAAIDPGIR